MPFSLEICCFDMSSVIIAQEAGAQRVEFCADPSGGGTTPGPGAIRVARDKLHIQLYPIIRPRGGDFLYSEEEFEIMMHDVAFCKANGCDGVVIGMLHKNGTIDKVRSAKLVSLAYPLGVTFHRAFDRAVDPQQALEDIIEIGCERILTSGQQPDAVAGAARIQELVTQADHRIIIMPGSGVRASNINALIDQTGAEEFHTSARIMKQTAMQYINQNMQEQSDWPTASRTEIEAIVHLLTHHQTHTDSHA